MIAISNTDALKMVWGRMILSLGAVIAFAYTFYVLYG